MTEVNVLKEERFQIVLTEEDKVRLKELAEANTGENKSMLIRKLIAQAWTQPKKFGLYPPKDVALTSIN